MRQFVHLIVVDGKNAAAGKNAARFGRRTVRPVGVGCIGNQIVGHHIIATVRDTDYFQGFSSPRHRRIEPKTVGDATAAQLIIPDNDILNFQSVAPYNNPVHQYGAGRGS